MFGARRVESSSSSQFGANGLELERLQYSGATSTIPLFGDKRTRLKAWFARLSLPKWECGSRIAPRTSDPHRALSALTDASHSSKCFYRQITASTHSISWAQRMN